MKTNNEIKKKKVSLLRDVFSFDPFSKSSEKIEKDEMIVHERNKITYTGFVALLCLFTLYGMLADFFDLRNISMYIFIILGIVNYGMLLGFCKKGIVQHTQSWSSLIFGLLTFPFMFICLILKPFEENKFYGIIQPTLIIILVILLYQIANIVYKKSQKSEEGENNE